MTDIRGTACVVPRQSDGSVNIPSWEEVSTSRSAFADAFRLLSGEQNPYSGGVICQRHGDRWLRCNPPALPLAEGEMDAVYALPFSRLPHPSYREQIPAHEQIRTSITTHRGCFGGCSFCAITHHQGRVIQSRSQRSIVDEVRWIASQQWFRGSISDLGGPTANMYAVSSANTANCEVCRRESCLWPNRCPTLSVDDEGAANMLRAVRGLPGVKHVVVSSGIRYDLLERQPLYFQELVAHHVGGLLKVAPEHTSDSVLQLMRKPGSSSFERFIERFGTESARIHKRQHIVPYLMAAHPGCTLSDMADTALFLKRNRLKVEQVQEFTPTPGTLSTCLYHTGIDPWTGNSVKVCRGDRERRMQKELLLWQTTERKKELIALLKDAGRSDVAAELFGHHQNRPASGRGGKPKKP
jgi:uncharacterized radical SAM protein YgiQ